MGKQLQAISNFPSKCYETTTQGDSPIREANWEAITIRNISEISLGKEQDLSKRIPKMSDNIAASDLDAVTSGRRANGELRRFAPASLGNNADVCHLRSRKRQSEIIS